MCRIMKIFVTGLTSSALGTMESHNLGNYIIVEPLFSLLRATFPSARIATSIQMADAFYERHKLIGCRDSRFCTYGLRTGVATALDALRILIWRVSRIDSLLDSPLLREIFQADLVIDFSGDIYGDNASWARFLEANMRLAFAYSLKKQVAMIVGSPGPFSTLWRLVVAKKMLAKLSLLTNREPLSTAMLAYVGIGGPQVYSTACPSVFFSPAPIAELPENEDFSQVFEHKTPIIGVILCGWNMPVGPHSRWPRDDSEFDVFVHLIEHLLLTTPFRICLMSHQNATLLDGRLIKGNDHRLIDRLLELLRRRHHDERVFALCGLYDAAQSKTIIGAFHILISGRVHGAVQGLSQGIPTAIIDYGHQPRAHKLDGFATVYGISQYVCDPADISQSKEVVSRLLANRSLVQEHLRLRVDKVKQLATKNFALLKSIAQD